MRVTCVGQLKFRWVPRGRLAALRLLGEMLPEGARAEDAAGAGRRGGRAGRRAGRGRGGGGPSPASAGPPRWLQCPGSPGGGDGGARRQQRGSPAETISGRAAAPRPAAPAARAPRPRPHGGARRALGCPAAPGRPAARRPARYAGAAAPRLSLPGGEVPRGGGLRGDTVLGDAPRRRSLPPPGKGTSAAGTPWPRRPPPFPGTGTCRCPRCVRAPRPVPPSGDGSCRAEQGFPRRVTRLSESGRDPPWVSPLRLCRVSGSSGAQGCSPQGLSWPDGSRWHRRVTASRLPSARGCLFPPGTSLVPPSRLGSAEESLSSRLAALTPGSAALHLPGNQERSLLSSLRSRRRSPVDRTLYQPGRGWRCCQSSPGPQAQV